MKNEDELADKARRAAAGDRAAAQELLGAVQDGVYRLALRFLGHPADAEDATQEILVVVLTHLGSFRGDSALTTWVWRIAANHLGRAKRGRREALAFDVMGERLRTGLRDADGPPDPETAAVAREVRLRCTQGMLLCLDRDLRIAYVLGDIFGLSGEEAAAVLDVEGATYRKRLSRARALLHDFMRAWCGVYDEANPCRCAGQAACAVERGIVDPRDLDLSRHPSRSPALARADLERAVDEVGGLLRVADVLRDHPDYAAPASMVERVRALLDAPGLAIFRPS